MKKRWLLCLTALILLVVLAAGMVAQRESNGIFYRVTGGGKDMYVLGSIHIGSKEMYPLNAAIRTAMHEADVMVFECDTNSQDAALTTQRLMRYENDTELDKHISPACMEDLAKVMKKTGYDMNEISQLKPWAVTSLLSMETLAAEMGTRDVHQASALGVENQVRKQMGEKTVHYLENVEEQLGLMDDFSSELQEYLLASACEAILHPEEARDDELSHWPRWWAEGDADAFAASYLQGLKEEAAPSLAQEYHDALITRRNKTMASQLRDLLESGKSSFVTVGLMHLVLPGDSILEELKLMGYQVEKIEN